ncbi:MAG: ribonuclease E inhibitor RraB [Pseudomonadota bacterium]
MKWLADRLWKGWDLKRETQAKGSQKDGNDGSIPRHTIHYAYTTTKAAEAAKRLVAQHLQQLGFEVSDTVENDGFKFEATSSVVGQSFDELTEELAKFLQSHDWEYDGWECAVVKVEG